VKVILSKHGYFNDSFLSNNAYSQKLISRAKIYLKKYASIFFSKLSLQLLISLCKQYQSSLIIKKLRS